MSMFDEDTELLQAIERSLEESRPVRPKSRQEQEDEELALAIALSLPVNVSNGLYQTSTHYPTSFPNKPSSSFDTSGSSFYVNKINGINGPSILKTCNFSDIITPPTNQTLQNCLFTTFMLDFTWLMTQLKLTKRSTIPVTIVEHWDSKSETQGITYVSNYVKVIHPKLFQYGNFHAKLFLLQFTDVLRVVVTSANLSEPDWTVVGQNIWFQDFKKINNNRSTNPQSNDFYLTLKDFLVSINIDGDKDFSLSSYDFSSSKAILLSSVPGAHNSTNLHKYGHMKLRSLVNSWNWAKLDKNINILSDDIDCQVSSVGALYENFVEQFYESCCGDLNVVKKNQKKRKWESNNFENFRIVYPTWNNVSKCKYPIGSGFLCLQKAHWGSNWFPKHLFYDLKNSKIERDGLLLHSKILSRILHVLDTSNAKAIEKKFGFVYVGSHNLSMAAWGRLQNSGTQLYISSYELGVVLHGEIEKEAENNIGRFIWEEQLPFSRPPPKYTSSDVPYLTQF